MQNNSDEGRAYYEAGKTYMINPIQKIVYIEYDNKIAKENLAGESSLSVNSLLTEPKIQTVAVYKGDEVAKNLQEIDPKWAGDKKLLKVEFWKYNPELFAIDGSVDPASLAASLSNEADERVQGELNDYLEEYKW